MNVNSLIGSGMLSANGGPGVSGGGAGVGGRIAIHHWGELTLPLDRISASGGGLGAQAGTVTFNDTPIYRWADSSGSILHDTEILAWEILARDPSEITVEIRAAGTLRTYQVGTELPPMGWVLWNTRSVPDGVYELRAIFQDGLSRVISEPTRMVVVNNSVFWHAGRITADEIWSASSVHVVEGDVTIASGVRLTIEPGTVVKFAEEARIIIENGGILDALATADLPIIFTTLTDDTAGGDTNLDGDQTKPIPGYWNRFVVQGCGEFNLSEFVSVRYIKTTHSGTLSNDETWLGDYVHHVTGDVTIASGVTLTIEQGAVVKFDRFKGITVSAGGRLSAMGSVAQPVYFTSIRDDSVGGDTNKDGNSTIPQADDWRRIRAKGGELELGHCHLSFGGGTSSGSWDSTGMIRTSGNA